MDDTGPPLNVAGLSVDRGCEFKRRGVVDEGWSEGDAHPYWRLLTGHLAIRFLFVSTIRGVRRRVCRFIHSLPSMALGESESSGG